jgi:hypothetical protein
MDPDGKMLCADQVDDIWVKIIDWFSWAIKVFFVLCSPLFIPKSFYIQEEEAVCYRIYGLDHGKQRKRKVMVHYKGSKNGCLEFKPEDHELVTEDTKDEKARLCEQPGLKGFEKVWKKEFEKETEPKKNKFEFSEVQLLVKPRRLLDENSVPVDMFTIFYDNLFRCQIRKLEPLKPVCGKPRCNTTWCTCTLIGLRLGRLLLLLLLSLPSVARLLVFWFSESKAIDRKHAAAEEAGLRLPWFTMFFSQLVPLHWLFIACYGTLLVDLLVYNSPINTATNKLFRQILVRSLRDMRDVQPRETCENMTLYLLGSGSENNTDSGSEKKTNRCWKLIRRPFCLLVYLMVNCITTIPTINLTVRLLWNFVTPCQTRKCPLLSFLTVLSLITLASLTLIFMKTVTFFVEIALYVLIGIVINAEVTVQYLFGKIMLLYFFALK